MVRAVFDTCILIDHLNGVGGAREELGRYAERFISVVTWMEVMVGTTPVTDAATHAFLDGFVVVPLDGHVSERAVAIRRERRMRLPDAIIAATAASIAAVLVTRNTKDFDATDPGVRVPYTTV
ncbi:type II toxin-antitoxin system VapC family toxin [uncultured Alsobacter sp.]|uniref:type II toxin-antitoxin system VapC family toxin n=1 Tax=uncultured Alsobacter sp. TaxID=1748258 RepID=UPI0025DB7E2F|nr:type II toxin-antitoxin system VapC family toxin [uncultured Alsobacter sp.]